MQYEIRTYYTFVQYKHLTGSTADTLLEYVERNLPEGVALKATKVIFKQLQSLFVLNVYYCRLSYKNYLNTLNHQVKKKINIM